VKKTSLYLEPKLDRAVARRAAAEGITKAERIRRTLAQAVAPGARPKPSKGVFDGPGDVAANVDRYLTETGFGDWR
jgi:ribbon-helix-helix CopG family protein